MHHLAPLALLLMLACSGASGSDPETRDETGLPGDRDPDGISGCWITQTDSGMTQLDLAAIDGVVTGELSWEDNTYDIADGIVDDDGLRFQVEWTDFDQICHYDFDEVASDALAGESECEGNRQRITADRSCD